MGSCQTRRNIIIRSHDILDDGRLLLDVQGDLGSYQRCRNIQMSFKAIQDDGRLLLNVQ